MVNVASFISHIHFHCDHALLHCQIKSNLFAQNTSHFNAASGKAVDEQGQQGSKEH